MKKYFIAFLFLYLFSSSSNSQNLTWTLQNPLPTPNNINDVVIFPDKYLIFGNAGTIVKIIDSSISFIYPDSLERDIYDADFINNVGYAVGRNGLLLKTSNGGSNWFHLNAGSFNLPRRVKFINANTGFICGNDVLLKKTTDGGATWRNINLSYLLGDLYDIYFIDSINGYLGSSNSTLGYLLKTTDGGETWNKINNFPIPSTVTAIYFHDINNGLVATYYGIITKTTNGGITWNIVDTVGKFNELKFINYNKGFASGDNGQVYLTTNSGDEWIIKNVSNGYVSNLYGLDAILNKIVVAGEAGIMFNSTDDGITWESIVNPSSRETLTKIKMISPSTGYAVGGLGNKGTILKTTNGGTIWELLPFDPGNQLWAIDVINSTIYIASQGPWGMFKSTDAGITFTALHPGIQPNSEDWRTIDFVNENTGYALGFQGILVKTTDGGVTWTELIDNFGYSYITDLQVFDENNFIIVGQDGKVSKSTNGGLSFMSMDVPHEQATLLSVFFINKMIGYIASSLGVYKTTNGGSNWYLVYSFYMGIPYVSDIVFINENIGLITSNSGYLAYTEDGGYTWRKLNNLHYNGVFHAATIQYSSLWVCGSYGAIFHLDFSSLPVELGSYNANVSDKNIALTWNTITETNNRGFEIERKFNEQWIAIGFIKGKGTSTEINNYSFIDDHPAEGKNIYRLKQINLDGSYEYIGQIEVDFNRTLTFELTQNYPNPFNPTTTISYSIPNNGFTTLVVYDMLGNEVATLVNEDKSAGSYVVDFNASNLSSGVYFYNLTSGSYSMNKKMILMK